MSATMDTRQRILDALKAAEITSATTGRLAAPCVLVEPGDPWSEPWRLPGRRVRWKLTAIAGKVDSSAAYHELGELVEHVDAALLTVDGVELPTWAAPADYSLSGVVYAASIATVQIASRP